MANDTTTSTTRSGPTPKSGRLRESSLVTRSATTAANAKNR
jgi:hypothetical protein